MAVALVSLASAASVALGASTLSAQPRPMAPANDDAEALARRALDARRAGRDEEALALFTRSNELRPRVSIEAQMGFALQALGRWLEAETRLAHVLERGDPWVARHRETLEESLVDVRAHLASLEVRGAPDGAQISIDGVDVATLPIARPLRVVAGRITVALRADGHLPSERVIEIHGGDLARETIELRRRASDAPATPSLAEPATNPPPTPATGALRVSNAEPPTAPVESERETSPRPTRRRRSREPGWSLAGSVTLASVGAAALVTSGVLVAVREGSLASVRRAGCVETDVDFLCDPSSANVSWAQSAHADATSAHTAAIASAAVGATFVVGAGLWLLIDLATRPAAQPPAERVSTPTLRLRGRGLEARF